VAVTALDRALRRAIADMRAERAQFALVGGLAVSAWAEPRLTRYADLAVAVNSCRVSHRPQAVVAR